ncbi:spermatocyte protein spe-8-like [Montipora foliosa]|uniref:spermatocyte protein spe-8-like n=1 Tax=Montipora foliosa TaxID=591990 RepID=UPI0035F1368B
MLLAVEVTDNFHACYREIKVIVKKMTHDDTQESKESAKKSLLREAEIVNALSDHTGLPMFFGVVTKKELLCLVTQFHGVNGESITLHKAANKRMITPLDSTEIFIQICLALKHVHSKGYLHNDIKANNVVLEKDLIHSSKFKPVLSDFGKSTKVAESSGSALSTRKRTSPAKTYLAQEVIKNRIYSIASDLYSLERMLKAVAKVVGFIPRFVHWLSGQDYVSWGTCAVRSSLD